MAWGWCGCRWFRVQAVVVLTCACESKAAQGKPSTTNALAFGNMGWVEPFQEAVWFSPFTADHDIVSRLVPEVIAEGSSVPILPRSSYIKILSINENEATCRQDKQRVTSQTHSCCAHGNVVEH